MLTTLSFARPTAASQSPASWHRDPSGRKRRASRTLWIAAVALAALPAALTAVAPAPVEAAPAVWKIDPSHSGVTFEVRHFFSLVPGRFTSFSGELTYDEAAPLATTVELEIEVSSIDTDNPKRDDHLRSADFFDAGNHPAITFKSTKVEAADQPDRYRVTGDLTMRGVTRPVTLDVEVLGFGPDAFGGTRGGFLVTGVVNRQDFGVTWNKKLDQGGTMLGDEVKVSIPLEVVKETPGK